MGKLCRAVCGALIAIVGSTATALAGGAVPLPITDFITVQPIDVCLNSASNCAIINNLGTGLNTVAAAGPNVQVGFASGGINLTQQALRLAGLQTVFLPTEQLIVTDPTLTNIAVNQTQTTPTSVFDSPTLRALTQQTLPNLISQGSTPTPPLSPNPTTINMFFVNSLVANPNTGPLFGISWIGNNGIAISQSIFGSIGRGGVTVNARADTIAHEIGHNLGLDHTTFGNQTQPASDLVTQGTLRTLPTIGVGANAGQPWISQVVTGGTVDQLNSQQVAAITNTSLDHFANPIPEVTVSGGDDAPIATPTPNFDFTVDFPAGDISGESLTQIRVQLPFFTDPDEYYFDTDVTITQPTDPNVLVAVNNCFPTEGRSNCLVFSFEGGEDLHALQTGESFSFNVGICAILGDDCVPADNNLLELSTNPTLITYTFSDGYSTTSDLLDPPDAPFASNSQNPDPTIGGSVGQNFTPFSNIGCVTATNTCPSLDLADGNPADETLPVPEPSSLALLVIPLAGAAPLLARRRRRYHGALAIV